MFWPVHQLLKAGGPKNQLRQKKNFIQFPEKKVRKLFPVAFNAKNKV
jgi:hypothetical protein